MIASAPHIDLQRRRLVLGLSQSDVAERLRVHPTAVSHVEAGRRRRLSRLVTLEDYARLLADLERKGSGTRRKR